MNLSPRYRVALYYGLPMLFCLVVHWLALKMWFFNDDFAWLGLRLEVHSPFDLPRLLFSPQAEGTVRTISERLFFLVFSSIFGLESPPFRVWVFLTQFASIVLLMQITRRLTGSAVAGFLAPILWSVNASIALAISWSAAYNQIAVAFSILLAFYLFLRYIDTGESKYWTWQWVVFLVGFGMHELNVMYPVLPALYALCCTRRYFLRTLFLFIPSVLFALVHVAYIPRPTDANYAMHYNSGALGMLWTYLAYATGALRDIKADWRPLWLGLTVTLLITLILGVFVIRKLRQREWLPLFLLAWFVAFLIPVLPLTNHFTEYYPAVPSIGLAILGAWAISGSSRPIALGTALALAALYFTVSITDTRMAEKYFYNRSRRMKYLIKGLESRPKVETSKVLLQGIDNDLFWGGFCDDPFRLLGIFEVYLTPGSEKKIEQHPEWGCNNQRYNISFDDTVVALRRGEAEVYALYGRRLRDITPDYFAAVSAEFAAKHPNFVDLGDPMYQSRLGPTWYRAEKNFRWMPKTATLKISAPVKAGQVLEVAGYCPAAVVANGPQEVSLRADGIPIGNATLKDPDKTFTLDFPLPSELVGKSTIVISIELGHTVKAGTDQRPLGLIFTTFTIK